MRLEIGWTLSGSCLHARKCPASQIASSTAAATQRTGVSRFSRLIPPHRFVLRPACPDANHPPQTSLMRNARVTVTSEGLQVITQVDLESYVSGVLRGEASILRTPAARQAMAILARTWALRWQGRHRGQGFDFCSLTHCQVFRPPQAREAEAADGLDPPLAPHAARCCNITESWQILTSRRAVEE